MHKADNILKNKNILVTGGTGFIGGRLIEILITKYGVNKISVLVRNFAHGARIARFPIEMFYGDITNSDSVDKACQDIDIVFNCVHDFTSRPNLQRQISIDGTKILAKAIVKNKVKKLIHISTVAVYGLIKDGNINEIFPYRSCGDFYSKLKIKSDQIIKSYYRKYNLPAVILQPTIV